MPEIKKGQFVVINKKHVAEVEKTAWGCHMVTDLRDAYDAFMAMAAQMTGKEVSLNEYYVCNVDEPYAQKVIDVILAGEAEKESAPQ